MVNTFHQKVKWKKVLNYKKLESVPRSVTNVVTHFVSRDWSISKSKGPQPPSSSIMYIVYVIY